MLTDAMIVEMVKVLGVVPQDHYNESGWVLPDGRLLNLAPPADRRGQPGYTAHRMSHQTSLDYVFPERGVGVADALRAGLVRIVPEECRVQVVRPLTVDQVATITAFILMHRKYGVVVDFGSIDADREIVDYGGEDTDPAFVVADIQKRLAERAGPT